MFSILKINPLHWEQTRNGTFLKESKLPHTKKRRRKRRKRPKKITFQNGAIQRREGKAESSIYDPSTNVIRMSVAAGE